MAKKRRKSVVCSNCGYTFEGIDNYCPNCGQENHSHHAPFRHLFLELIGGFTHFDTKFFTTAKALLLHPGKLTSEYILDRRARSVAPLRLYVFVSFIFFFVLSLSPKHDSSKSLVASQTSAADTGKGNIRISLFSEGIVRDSFPNPLKGRRDVTEETVDSLVEANAKTSSWLSKLLLKQGVEQDLGMITKSEIEHAFMKNIGFSLFILMPLFALLLKLFYIRKKRLYIEHLVFSLHFHSFNFILLTIATLFLKAGLSDVVFALAFLIIPVYCIIAMKNVYGGGWLVTTVKAIFIFPLYSVCILAIMAATLVTSFMVV
jgi:hypothetical protein